MGDLGFEPRTSGLRVRCATVAPVTPPGLITLVGLLTADCTITAEKLQPIPEDTSPKLNAVIAKYIQHTLPRCDRHSSPKQPTINK